MSGAWERETLARSLARVPLPAEPLLERRAAVALVLHLTRDAGAAEVLLIQRAERDGDPWSGQVSLPGGRFEARDDDLLRTAVRETWEELGVDLDREAQHLGALAPLRARARGKIVPLDVAPFVFAVGARPPTRLCAAEVADCFWFPLRQAASGALDRPFTLQHEGQALQLPSWSFAGRTVWGMTHRILSSLIELVESASPVAREDDAPR